MGYAGSQWRQLMPKVSVEFGLYVCFLCEVNLVDSEEQIDGKERERKEKRERSIQNDENFLAR